MLKAYYTVIKSLCLEDLKSILNPHLLAGITEFWPILRQVG